MARRQDGSHDAARHQRPLAPAHGPLRKKLPSHKKGGGYTMNRGSNVAADLIVYSMLVGGILVLTRPKSQGPAFVRALTSGYARIVQATTGQPATA